METITANSIENKNKKTSLWRKLNPLFWICVIIPSVFSLIYYALFASDIYISESSFVVRSPHNQTSLSGVGALLQNTGFIRSQDDTYTVQEYMRSRTALEQLQQVLPVRSFYEEKGDLLSRFNAFGFGDSDEAFYQYFREHLNINLDSVSGIATLRVRTFSSDEGQQINQNLLTQAEALINRLNERARKDTITFAEQAVKEAQDNVTTTADLLTNYRVKHQIFDLPAQSSVQLTLISSLKNELIRVETQLAQLQSITPDNPQVQALKMRQRSLKAEIDQQSKSLSGSGISIATQSAEYQRLVLENELAQKQLTAAMASLQNTRGEADRQQLYLEVINQPSKPDLAFEPHRIYNIIATFIIGLILYGVFSLLLASMREHKN
ncbi:capsule polysaccharide transporter [Pasteurella bettyae]|uniref:Polysaccharide export inner-membrane protein, BexC/CtrB/KpsE family n=1 Tax=Pasteurella bettyae CCUG 2042 TaxID=1095749 RepID=I3DAL9_9PAST|nr:capsule polysaccharide transporter [Pasteurella bettyae]EIJ68762.1 polysaccharide export inner-membrane protein, BexC/CtrB/KpsE family [Pasteurella bettyae CCUG 2042]SUB20922.1 protein HexC [Pasteurella bettyae]